MSSPFFLDNTAQMWYNNGEDIKIKTQSVFGGKNEEEITRNRWQ